MGSVNKAGYGAVSFGPKENRYRMGAHRYAYAMANGVNPGVMDVMHTCDNPSCVNPDHLRIGTRSDNMRDCVQKGRHFTPWRK